MKQLVEGFIQQLQHAIEIGEKATVDFAPKKYSNIVIAGMGGSGIGGNLIQAYVSDKLEMPLAVNKGYDIPAFVGPDTLFIASSFSGNTEETLSGIREALAKGATLACVTSGGEVLRLSKENNFPHIIIPGDSEQPRACLGYSVVEMLYLLHYAGVLNVTFKTELAQTIALLEEQQSSMKVEASALANAFKGKLPILYAGVQFEPIAVRFQQQINENSKQLSHVNTFPEMNHNEIVGWLHPEPLFEMITVLYIRSAYDHERIRVRMDVSKKIFESKAGKVLEVQAQGSTFLEQAFSLIHIFDWVTVYLAELNNVSPNTIENINYVKGELAKV